MWFLCLMEDRQELKKDQKSSEKTTNISLLVLKKQEARILLGILAVGLSSISNWIICKRQPQKEYHIL